MDSKVASKVIDNKLPSTNSKTTNIFEINPLAHVRDRRTGQFYSQEETWEEPDARYYYGQDDVQKLTYYALIRIGVSLSQLPF